MALLKSIFISVSAVVGLGISACATTDTTAHATSMTSAKTTTTKTTTNTVTNVADSDPNKRVCKYEAMTGSKFRKKICASTAEWAAREAAARQATEGVQRGNRGAEPSR